MNRKQVRKLSLVGLAVTATAVALVAATVWGAMNARDRHERSDAVIRAADAVLASVTDAETAQRGWLLTGVDTFLEPGYRDGVAGSDRRLDELRRRVDAVGDGVQSGRVEKVSLLVRRKRAEMQFTIDQTREGRKLFAVAHVRDGDGRQVMEQIRLELAAVKQTETVRIQGQYDAAVRRSGLAIAVGLLGLLVQAFTLSVVYMLTRPRATDRVTDVDAVRPAGTPTTTQ